MYLIACGLSTLKHGQKYIREIGLENIKTHLKNQNDFENPSDSTEIGEIVSVLYKRRNWQTINIFIFELNSALPDCFEVLKRSTKCHV